SSRLKDIFSIFNKSGAARIVFIHRYFLTPVSSINPITNLPPEPILCESFSRLKDLRRRGDRDSASRSARERRSRKDQDMVEKVNVGSSYGRTEKIGRASCRERV